MFLSINTINNDMFNMFNVKDYKIDNISNKSFSDLNFPIGTERHISFTWAIFGILRLLFNFLTLLPQWEQYVTYIHSHLVK